MAGEGFYGRHSAPQHAIASLGLDLLDTAVDHVELPADDRPLIVADFGAAQAHNALAPMQRIIDRLRARTSSEVVIVHTDLPSNDWATLFEVVDGSVPSQADGTIHSFAAGRSFYDRIFPARSVAVGWTSSTLHWLRNAPGPITDHFFVQLSSDDAARQRYREQSEQDWRDFLRCRAVELRPNGSVVFVDTLMGDDQIMGGEALFDALQASIATMHRGGAISDAGYGALAYPTWFRTEAELRAPFSPEFAGPSGAALRLVDLRTVVLDDPFLAAFQTSGDAGAYAAAQVGFLRGFLEPSFEAELAGAGAGDPGPALDGLWQGLTARLAADPLGVSPRWRIVVGRVRRSR